MSTEQQDLFLVSYSFDFNAFTGKNFSNSLVKSSKQKENKNKKTT